MPYEISWLVKNHVVHLHLSGDVSLEMLVDVSQNLIHYFESSDRESVHLMINDADVGRAPKQVTQLLDIAKALRHPRLGWFIIYGTDNLLFRFISFTLANVLRLRHRRFLTQQEAYVFLQSVDSTLPNLDEVSS